MNHIAKEIRLEPAEEDKIDVVEEVGYHFYLNAFDVNPSNKIDMKKFRRGYPEITCGGDEVSESITKIETDSVYSELKQPTISIADEIDELDDISDILKRNIPLKAFDSKSKLNRRCNFSYINLSCLK